MDPDEIQLILSGFHFCQYPLDVLKYYWQDDALYALVKAEDKVIHDNDLSVTNKITILQLLTREDLNKLMPNEVVRQDGKKEWYVNGQLHRLDGPAIEFSSGSKQWFKNGQLHRLDGPAIEWMYGTKEWYKEGRLHRLDGPAIEDYTGIKEWYTEGKRHRLEKPAIEFPDGRRKWYEDGQFKLAADDPNDPILLFMAHRLNCQF
jgi:hypothetical protein